MGGSGANATDPASDIGGRNLRITDAVVAVRLRSGRYKQLIRVIPNVPIWIR